MQVNWYERSNALIELASIDEADTYEVDQASIFYDPKIHKFILLVASGCSCWDGEAYEEQHDSLESLGESLHKIADERPYSPTLEGADALLQVATDKWENMDIHSVLGDNMAKMTKEKLLTLLRTCEGGESGHMDADAALLEYIDDVEISEAFNSIHDMWYS